LSDKNYILIRNSRCCICNSSQHSQPWTLLFIHNSRCCICNWKKGLDWIG